MKLLGINVSDTIFNHFTKGGRIRKGLVEYMKDSGCSVIRERKAGKNAKVILGYKNEYTPLANFSALIYADGSYERKTSDCLYSPLPSSIKHFESEKVKVNKKGYTKKETKTNDIFDGSIIRERTTSCIYGDSTTVDTYNKKGVALSDLELANDAKKASLINKFNDIGEVTNIKELKDEMLGLYEVTMTLKNGKEVCEILNGEGTSMLVKI